MHVCAQCACGSIGLALGFTACVCVSVCVCVCVCFVGVCLARSFSTLHAGLEQADKLFAKTGN